MIKPTISETHSCKEMKLIRFLRKFISQGRCFTVSMHEKQTDEVVIQTSCSVHCQMNEIDWVRANWNRLGRVIRRPRQPNDSEKEGPKPGREKSPPLGDYRTRRWDVDTGLLSTRPVSTSDSERLHTICDVGCECGILCYILYFSVYIFVILTHNVVYLLIVCFRLAQDFIISSMCISLSHLCVFRYLICIHLIFMHVRKRTSTLTCVHASRDVWQT